MIDKDILDEVLPVPELETLKEQTIGELKEEGFAITTSTRAASSTRCSSSSSASRSSSRSCSGTC